jgi:hypothetical protein
MYKNWMHSFEEYTNLHFIFIFFQKDTDQVQNFLDGKLSMLDSNTKMSYFQLQMIVKFNKFSSTYFHMIGYEVVTWL